MEYLKKQVPDLPRMEMNANELHIIEFIAGLDVQLTKGDSALESRLRTIPDGWRKYRLARSAIASVLEGLYATMPIKNVVYMNKLCSFGEVIVRPRTATPTDDVQIVPTPELKLLINKVIENECAMCIKDQREQRKCKLRKALMFIAPPQEVNKDGCNYRDVVAGCELGEYI